ncbi:MAG: ATP-dependent sacrificial sulfur transferase LarE [Desulfobacterales bacterium]|jgi:uncharacterized protein
MKNTDDFEEQPALYAKRLKDYFSGYAQGIVAYSGGVDSALLAFVAHLVLGQQMVAILADSPSLSRREYSCAIDFAENHHIPLQIVRTQEMQNPAYRDNPANRCYFCKKALFERIEQLRERLQKPEGISAWPIFYGANLDDLDDFRPGMQAANEASILAPYIELGFDKRTVRAICVYFDLEIAEKPAMPCMASRIVYGERVTPEKLNQVEQAENFLYGLGFDVLRVRHHGDTARIEVLPQDFEAIIKHRNEISRKFQELGFVYVSLDLNGYKSGSLNAVLK